jgi:acyl dehydratase
MRMMAPVKIGDTITVTVKVMEKSTTSDPKKGIQVWRYTVSNQRGEKVMQHDYKMMFHLRG